MDNVPSLFTEFLHNFLYNYAKTSMTEYLPWTKEMKLQPLGGAHDDLAIEAVRLVWTGAVDENRAVFLAATNGQLFSGKAFAHIGHGDLLKKNAVGTKVQLRRVTGKVHIANVADMTVDVGVGIV